MLRTFDHECDIILSSIRGQAGKKTYIDNLFVFHSNKCKIKERDPSIFFSKRKRRMHNFYTAQCNNTSCMLYWLLTAHIKMSLVKNLRLRSGHYSHHQLA